MKDRKLETPNPRIKVRTRLLEMARIIRRTGNPDEAMEAAEWEKMLQAKIEEESQIISKAA